MSAKSCPLTANSLPIGTALQTFGLALMAGGMLALGAFTAPVVFGQLPRDTAGPIMAVIFSRYDYVLIGGLVLILVGEALRRFSGKVAARSVLAWVRYGLLAVLTGSVLYNSQVLNPEIQHLQKAGIHRNLLTAEGRQFEKTHKLAEGLYKLALLDAILLILLTPFAGTPAQSGGCHKDTEGSHV